MSDSELVWNTILHFVFLQYNPEAILTQHFYQTAGIWPVSAN